MTIVRLKEGGRPGKYGLVQVLNADGSFAMEYKITGAELAAFHKQASGVPPRCTSEEWREKVDSGRTMEVRDSEGRIQMTKVMVPRALVLGKSCDVGEYSLDTAGRLAIKYGEREIGGRFLESWIVLEPDEWTGTPPSITATPAATAKLAGKIVSLVNGVVTTV